MTISATTPFYSIIKIMLTFGDSTHYFLCGMKKKNGKGIEEFLVHTFTLSPTEICITEICNISNACPRGFR